MALRCLYTDLDGTLLGRFGSLFADADGNFSRNQALLLEACHRAGVEVVVMSGRREAQVQSDSRLMGQSSYIYEAGCGMVIDRERTLLTGERWVPDETRHPGRADGRLGAPGAALRAVRRPARVARTLARGPGALAARSAARSTSPRPTSWSPPTPTATDLRFLDNGAISRPMEGIEIAHAYHLVPGGASKGKAVGAHMRARGYRREECIAAGDSIEDLGAAEYVGRFFCMANGYEKDEALRTAIGAFDNVTVTDGRMGDGVYEAVVATLAQR